VCRAHSQVECEWVRKVGVERGPTHHLEILSNIHVEVDVKLRRGDVCGKRPTLLIKGKSKY
jgi:hypothetical protein